MDFLEELEKMEEDDRLSPNPPSPALSPSGPRPEAIMGILAALSAVLLIVMLVLCRPYFTVSDDPEAPMHNPQIQAAETQEFLEPAVSQEEPENPTVPPERNPFDRNDFQYNSRNYLLLQNLPSCAGVDVSAWQGEIDWQKVKDAGIEFAFIRIGFRGYESGKLNEDEYGQANLDGAAAAGVKVGACVYA